MNSSEIFLWKWIRSIRVPSFEKICLQTSNQSPVFIIAEILDFRTFEKYSLYEIQAPDKFEVSGFWKCPEIWFIAKLNQSLNFGQGCECRYFALSCCKCVCFKTYSIYSFLTVTERDDYTPTERYLQVKTDMSYVFPMPKNSIRGVKMSFPVNFRFIFG